MWVSKDWRGYYGEICRKGTPYQYAEIRRNPQKHPSNTQKYPGKNTPINTQKYAERETPYQIPLSIRRNTQAKIPRQQIYGFIEILIENIASFNVSGLGNWHLMPSQLGLAILQGVQNCNRQDCLWHFGAHAVSYC